MQRKRLSKCVPVHLATAALLLACHWTQTEASVLRKTDRRDGRKEATGAASGVREGVIVFGKGPANASLGELQADSAGFRKGKVFDVSSKEAQWRRMSPSLQCGQDQMKFRATGSPVFGLGQTPSMPLSHVPSKCGYKMLRNPSGVVMTFPYHGCHVANEGGHYTLPLRWQGVPVTLRCPKPKGGTTPAAPQDPAQLPGSLNYLQLLWQQLQQNPNMAQDPALWNAYYSYWHHNKHQSTTPRPPQDPAQGNPYFSHRHQLHHDQHQSTTPPPPPQDPAQGNPYFSHRHQLHYDQHQSTTPPPPQDPAQGNPFFAYWHQNQHQSTTPPPPPQDPAQGNPFFAYWHQLHHNQHQSTPPPPQNPAQGNPLFAHWHQLHHNQHQSTTPPPPQDPAQWNPYFAHWHQNQH